MADIGNEFRSTAGLRSTVRLELSPGGDGEPATDESPRGERVS